MTYEMYTITKRDAKVELDTRNGVVRGLESAGIHIFKGIPFAAPIKGINRWLPPQPRRPFEGVFDATEHGLACPQQTGAVPKWLISEAGFEYLKGMTALGPQGEDCLNLNVCTPTLEPSDALPVMVWIHGGGFAIGSGSCPETDGTALARQGMVLVRLNYRLGCMGFMAGDGLFDGETCIGNRGLMDQVAALQWVRDNIAQFGGDPNNVTIFGSSAGGTSVAALLTSPKSEGLFHRAIIQSGPINLMPLEDHLKCTRDVLKALQIPLGDAEALAAIPNKKIVGMLMQRFLFRRGSPYGKMSATKLPFAGAYGTAFLPYDVLDAMAQGAARNIDLLVGTARHDGRGLSVAMPGPKALTTRFFNYMIAGMIGETKEQRKAIVAKYKALMPDAPSFRVREQIQTDALYRMRSIRAAEIQRAFGNTFMYQFNWESPTFGGVLGAIHALDVPFVFNNLDRAKHLIGNIDEAQPLATAMSEAWVSFARTGTPSSPSLPQWPQYDKEARQTMIFDRECRVESDPDGEMREIWGDMYW